MTKVNVEFPDKFVFSTKLEVRINEINYGNHLGNDSVLSLVQEARIRFFRKLGFESELLIAPIGIILADAAIVFKAESIWGDKLNISIGLSGFTKSSLEMYYKFENVKTGKLVAKVKTGIVFFDYDRRKITKIPDFFMKSYNSFLQSI
ncbi:MAG TPA: thioesterase family protein [Victivallales bacterium]|nr:thioesterase family protein [Victivallales bacterium]